MMVSSIHERQIRRGRSEQQSNVPSGFRRGGLWVLLLYLSTINLAYRLLNLPLNRVIELRYCKDYYLEHDPTVIGPDGMIPEGLCKVNSIQEKLAWLQGVIEMLIVICGAVFIVHSNTLPSMSNNLHPVTMFCDRPRHRHSLWLRFRHTRQQGCFSPKHSYYCHDVFVVYTSRWAKVSNNQKIPNGLA